MTRYAHLTIFQKSYDLTLRMCREVHNFPKGYKYTLGEKLQNVGIEILDGIIIANSEKDKREAIRKINQDLERLRIFVRLCYSLGVIGKKKYEVLEKYIDEIGKMAGGWLKASVPGRSPAS